MNLTEKPLIVGVMGGGACSPAVERDAYRLGQLIAEKGWALLNGGRGAGVMDASAKGARDAGGLTIGILPDNHPAGMSEHILIPIFTGMGNARNCINVLSSDVVTACEGGCGTLSEIALALKTGKPVVLLNYRPGGVLDAYMEKGVLFHTDSPEAAVEAVEKIVSNYRRRRR